jgi:hypothetical protein
MVTGFHFDATGTYWRRSTYLLLAIVALATLTSCAKPAPIVTTTESERVAAAFNILSTSAKLKDGLPPTKLSPRLVGRTSLPDGMAVSLWVTSEQARPALDHCFYLDFSSTRSKATVGESACGGLTEEIVLNRWGSIVFGNAGNWHVDKVRVLVHGKSVELPVTEDYFLIPGALAPDATGSFTITLLDQWREPFGVASDLLILGGTAPSANVSAIPHPVIGLTGCAAAPPYTSPHPVSESVRAAATAYYKAKNLLPITIYKDEENFLNLVTQRLGVHWCDSGGVIGGYGGQVPASATSAVMVYVSHAPYPGNNPARDHFLTIAMIPGKGWQVVGENTGP